MLLPALIFALQSGVGDFPAYVHEARKAFLAIPMPKELGKEWEQVPGEFGAVQLGGDGDSTKLVGHELKSRYSYHYSSNFEGTGGRKGATFSISSAFTPSDEYGFLFQAMKLGESKASGLGVPMPMLKDREWSYAKPHLHILVLRANGTVVFSRLASDAEAKSFDKKTVAAWTKYVREVAAKARASSPSKL